MRKRTLPRKSAANTRQAMQVLATAKMLKDLMGPTESDAKAYLLEKEMTPKDRRTVTSPGGQDIGTISMVQLGRKRGTGLKVDDPVKFAAWCERKGIPHPGKPSVSFPPWFVAEKNLQVLIEQAEGEIPEGVVDTTEEADPYLVVRQSPAQALALREEFASSQVLYDTVAPYLLEGGRL